MKALLIGITGNIGSGKSAFCRFLELRAQRVIFADEVAQRQLDKADLLEQISKRWGADFISEGRANRKKIAATVFANPEELAFLNSLVHPKTLEEFQTIVRQSPGEPLFFEVPLLFEARLEPCFDHLVIITAPREIRLQRVLQRSSDKPEEILARMDAQMDDAKKIPLCDLVVQNSGSLEELRQAADALILSLPTIKAREKRPFYP